MAPECLRRFPFPEQATSLAIPETLDNIIDFIKSCRPDVVGLLEVDVGSCAAAGVNQAEAIARALGHYSCYECKYGEESLNQILPILRKQANAFLAAPHILGERFHYFDTGIKRLIIELELDGVIIFLVHLSLKYRHRQFQLRHLYDLISRAPKAGNPGRRLQYLLGRDARCSCS